MIFSLVFALLLGAGQLHAEQLSHEFNVIVVDGESEYVVDDIAADVIDRLKRLKYEQKDALYRNLHDALNNEAWCFPAWWLKNTFEDMMANYSDLFSQDEKAELRALLQKLETKEAWDNFFAEIKQELPYYLAIGVFAGLAGMGLACVFDRAHAYDQIMAIVAYSPAQYAKLLACLYASIFVGCGFAAGLTGATMEQAKHIMSRLMVKQGIIHTVSFATQIALAHAAVALA